MALTCDRCLSGRHSILCETGPCACNLCSRPEPVLRKAKKRRAAKPRAKQPRVYKKRVLTPEDRKRYSEAQKLRYREKRNDPDWTWKEDKFAEKLNAAFAGLAAGDE